ncbi:MAG: DNA primase [Patescibacteria group bacterium]|nr:DNA primase [Patescibacteria group bacterium]
MSEIEQIKSKLDIVDLIGEYLQLRPAGSGSFKACCPFHHEKTPSFFVSKSKQIWHCFGCGEGGDQFAFVMKMDGVDFPEALRLLAAKAGVTLPEYNREQTGLRQKLIALNDLAAKFYHRVLLESQSAEAARKYIEKRNLPADVVEEFMLGYAPDKWEILLNFLKKKEYSESDINEAGLVSRKERGSGYYDRFRGRVVFPIRNIHGNTVGFTARLLDPEAKEAKYINTPQTKIYNKSEVIYGLDRAKRAIQQEDLAVMVEGNMDAITSHRVGVKNAIASSGTALTAEQVGIIKRYTQNIAFAFDADAAGQTAVKRGIDMALASDMNVSVILISGAKDPDELANRDPELWKKAIKEKVGAMEYYFSVAKKNFDLNSASGKKQASVFLLSEIARIKNRVEQSHWLQQLSKMIDVGEQILRESLPAPARIKEQAAPEPPKPVLAEETKEERVWAKLISILINRPELITAVQADFHPEYIWSESYQQLYKNLILFYNDARSGEGNIYQELEKFIEKSSPDKGGVDFFRKLALAGERDWPDFESADLQKELLKICAYAEALYHTNEKQKLVKQMREAEEKGDKELVEKIMKKYQGLESSD